MRRSGLILAIASTLFLGGCGDRQDAHSPRPRSGRYAGIGIYPASQAWSLIEPPKAQKDKMAAKPDDDDQVIVAVDSLTGEIRQCGNISGFCIGMNPWTGALPAGQAAPVQLTIHAEDVNVGTAGNAVQNQADASPKASRSRR